MRTTVRLDDALLDQAKREASRRGETLTALIEKGLRLVLAQRGRSPRRPPIKLPTCQAGGGTWPGVDLSRTADLIDRMENER